MAPFDSLRSLMAGQLLNSEGTTMRSDGMKEQRVECPE